MSSELGLSLVSYTGSCSVLVLVLGTESVSDLGSVLDLGSGSLSIFFIVEYQFFWYLRILSLVWGVAVRVTLGSLV